MALVRQIFGAIRDVNPHKGEPLESLYPKILTRHCNTTPTSGSFDPGTPTGRRATAKLKTP